MEKMSWGRIQQHTSQSSSTNINQRACGEKAPHTPGGAPAFMGQEQSEAFMTKGQVTCRWEMP